MICGGSLLSSSTILPLSIQAGTDDDTSAATVACLVTPWLVSTGWILQYTSLFAKSYRMYHVIIRANRLRRTTMTVWDTFRWVLGALLVNWTLVLCWTLLDPLRYERQEIGETWDRVNGIVVHESFGYCTSENMRAWVGSLLGFHLTIMVATNGYLWTLRAVDDRYQESKYITLASIFACEFLLLGIPMLIAVEDSSVSRYIVLVCMVGFTDFGILLMLFVPKIRYQIKGLPEGTSVAASIIRNNAATSSRQLSKIEGGGQGIDSQRAVIIEENKRSMDFASTGSVASVSIDAIASNQRTNTGG